MTDNVFRAPARARVTEEERRNLRTGMNKLFEPVQDRDFDLLLRAINVQRRKS